MPLLLSRGVIRRIPILMGGLTVPHLGLMRVSERGGPLPTGLAGNIYRMPSDQMQIWWPDGCPF